MRFRVPIVVAQAGPAFTARPLFHPAPTRTDDNLSRLLGKLAGELVRAIEVDARADRQDAAARWAFAPAVETHRLPVAIELRRRVVRAKFLFVTFRHLGRRLAFTPSLPDLWFEVGRGELLADRAKAVHGEHWRQEERDADDPDALDPAAGQLAGKAWVQVVELAARVPAVPAKVEPPKFLMIGGGERPDGATELRRVGRCLDALDPDDRPPAVRRDPEAAELVRLLAAPDRRPVLLVGPRAVGKTAIVHAAVARRAADRAAGQARTGNVWLLSPQRLISGMSFVGQWEGRLLAILKHAGRRDHVLFFDDLLGLFLAGVTGQSALSAAVLLRPHLEDRTVRVLGEVTPDGLRALRERDRGFADQFHVLPIREPGDAETLRTLVAVQRRLEGRHGCRFGLDALPAAIDAARRFDRASAFPGKAAAALTRLAVRAAARPPADPGADPLRAQPVIGRDDVLADVAARSGLSLAFLDPRRRLDRDAVRDELAAQVIGQPAVAEALADVVSVAKARLNDPDRPLAAFLLLGPTGVGKTESAKAVARVLFGDPDRLLRFDLNEFNQPGAAATLVGTFTRPEGLLTAAVRREPFAVILLDEVEKADPEVFDVLLQVLGEGRLTDALGRTADFTTTIILLTSNLGVRESGGTVGFGAADDPRAFVRAAERFFRPEFVNRLDRVIPFARLARADLHRIADRLVRGVLGRTGFAQRNCVLQVTPDALERVTEAGYDPALGARAMKRAVERELTRPAAAALAALPPDELTVVTVRAGAGELVVDVRAPGWADRLPARDPLPVADRLDAAGAAVDRLNEQVAGLRPAGPVGGRVTPEQERYYALRELLDTVGDTLDRLLEAADRHAHLEDRLPNTVGRKARLWLRSLPRDHDGRSTFQALRVAASAVGMVEAVRELFDRSKPADPEPDLLDLEHRLALLALMASAPADDRPVLLHVRGFPAGTVDRDPASRVAGMYTAGWADGLGVEVQALDPPDLPAGDRLLAVKGVHARPLARTEVGTHLVLPAHGGPVPVRVTLLDRWPPVAVPDGFAPVVRVLPHGQPILDVRTGLAVPAPYPPDALRALTLAVLPRA